MTDETTKPEILTVSMSKKDLEVIANALQKNIVTMQLEFSELEKKAGSLKKELDQTVAMLSIMKQRLAD
jgi:hypothetical protein